MGSGFRVCQWGQALGSEDHNKVVSGSEKSGPDILCRHIVIAYRLLAIVVSQKAFVIDNQCSCHLYHWQDGKDG